jgi:hypothetical protein
MKNHKHVDDEVIRQLEMGREAILSGESAPGLVSALRRRLHTATRNIYVIDHLIEQSEDIYHVLIDGTLVASVEIPRNATDAESDFEAWPLEEYRRQHRLGKTNRRRLEFAIQLAGSSSRS